MTQSVSKILLRFFFLATASLLTSCNARVSSGDKVVSQDTIIAALAVNSVSPTSGPMSGGTPLTIRGQGFLESTVVKLGGRPCENLKVMSNTEIRCLSPNSLAGTVDVAVVAEKNMGGLPAAFTYIDLSRAISASLSINNGNDFTRSNIVDLSFTGNDLVSMYVTNDSSCNTGGVEEPYVNFKKNWRILDAQKNSIAAVYVKFKDSEGNSVCIGDNITHDDKSPELSGLAILPISPSSTPTPTVNFKLNEKATVTLFQKSCDDTKNEISPPKFYSSVGTSEALSIATNPLSPGVYNIYAKATDLAGNPSACNEVVTNYQVDTVKPALFSVSIEPSSSPSKVNTPTVKFSLTKAATVTIYNESCMAGNEISASVAKLAEASSIMTQVLADTPVGASGYNIFAEAISGSLKSDCTPIATNYRVDTQKPVITKASEPMTPVSPSSNTTPTANFSLSESATVTLYKDLNDGKGACVNAISGSFARPLGATTLIANSLAEGTYNIYAKAVDDAKNESDCTPLVSNYVISTVPLEIKNTSIEPISPSKVNTPTVKFLLTKAATVTIYKDSCMAANAISTSVAKLAEASSIMTKVLADTPEGDNGYNIFAEAISGGLTSGCVQVASKYRIDTQKPMITKASEPMTPVSPSDITTPTANFSLSEAAAVTLYKTNCDPSNAISASVSKPSGSNTLLTSVLPENTYNIYVKAIDDAKNESDCTPLVPNYVVSTASPEIKNISMDPPSSPSKVNTPTVKFLLTKAATVTIYKESCMTGNEISASVAKLAEASSIMTKVLADTPVGGTGYKIYAQAVSGNLKSSCTEVFLGYKIDTQGPTITAVSINPISPTDNLTPTASFTLSEDASVKLYDSVGCLNAISPVAALPAGATSLITNNLATGTYNIHAKAVDGAGNESICTLIALSYVVRTIPLALTDVSISPSPATNTPTPNVKFSLNKPAFVRLYGTATCGSPLSAVTSFQSGPNSIATYPFPGPGKYTVSIKAFELQDQEASAPCTPVVSNYIYEITPPKIAFYSIVPASGSFTDIATVNLTLNEKATVTLYQESGCDPKVANPISDPKELSPVTSLTLYRSISTLSLPPNSYDIYAQAVDLAGNKSTCVLMASSYLMTAKPVITPVSLSPSRQIFYDYSVLKVLYTINIQANVVLYFSTTSATSCSLPISNIRTGVPNKTNTIDNDARGFSTAGAYYITARATDLNKTSNVSDCTHMGTIVVDRTAPVLSALSMTPATYSGSATPTANFTLTEAGKAQVALYGNDSNCIDTSKLISDVVTFDFAGDYTLKTRPLPAGLYNIYGLAIDEAGNRSKCTPIATNYKIDFTKPTISAVSIEPANRTNSRTVTVNLTLDKSAKATLYSDENCGKAISGTSDYLIGISKFTPSLDRGVYNVFVQAVDQAGNVSKCEPVVSNYTVEPFVCGDAGNSCYENATALSTGWAELPDPDKTIIVYTQNYCPPNQSATYCFKIWQERDGKKRVLNSSGLWAHGWQKMLNRSGIGYKKDSSDPTQEQDLTDPAIISKIAGRACPPSVFIDPNNMISLEQRCLYYDAGTTKVGLYTYNPTYASTNNLSAVVEGEDWLYGWNRTPTGRGIDSSFYEGNNKVCADKGMRVPTLYEFNVGNTPPDSTYLPKGDGAGIVPQFTQTKGVPPVQIWTSVTTVAPYYTFSSTAFYSTDPLRYWTVFGSANETRGYDASVTPSNYAIRCVLP